MSLEINYRPNSPNVIHEVIDGEAVLVSMESGSYYSIDNVGAAVWGLIENGLSVPQIVNSIAGQYAGTSQDIEAGVAGLIAQLQEERLIVPAEASQNHQNNDQPISAGQNKPPFVAPVLHKYSDMEDLLLLDPIHEVDDTGWPNLSTNE